MKQGGYRKKLEQARQKRGWILFAFALIQFTILLSFSLIQMYINGVSFYISLPLCAFSALLTSLGGSVFLLFAYGAYAALLPVAKDDLNPINYAVPLEEGTRIAILMPVYHEDPARVAGGLMAMMEELSQYDEADHFDWFLLSDSRNEDIIIQEQYLVFLLREKFKNFKIGYRQRIVNTFAKVGNTSDFYRRWGRHYKYVIMLDADSILPGESCITLARTIEGNENTALIQSRFFEVTSSTLFGIVSNFRFLFDNLLYTYYYNYFNPGRGFYMGHNAIIRTDAFMKYCNLPISDKTRFFPEGKMISHDYYEGSLLIGAGYETWILPQIVSFDQQLHNIATFYIRERRWLVGAQSWFKFFMSKSLSTFGKVNMLQRALFYYAATIGFVAFLLSYYGLHYTFTHPLKTRILVIYYHKYQNSGYNKWLLYLSAILLLPATSQLTIHYIVFRKKHQLQKMGGSIKFIFSYFLFSFLQSNIMLIAMCLINKFLFDWARRKKLVWAAQDRDGALLPWGECIRNFYPISLIGFGILLYIQRNIFPYMHARQFRLLGIHIGPWGIAAFKFSIIFPALVFFLAPAIARLTSRSFLWMKKLKWLKTPYDDEDLYPVVSKTYAYTEEMKMHIPATMTFAQAIADPWFAIRHMATTPYRPNKYRFWKEKLEKKNIEDCTRLEKLVIFRCRELWEMFFLKEYKRNNAED